MTDRAAKPKCQAVMPIEYLGSYPCVRAGVLRENGKWWCRQHAPSAIEARRKKRDEKWDAEAAAAGQRQETLRYGQEAIELLREIAAGRVIFGPSRWSAWLKERGL